jgi:uncharacterized membrane protein
MSDETTAGTEGQAEGVAGVGMFIAAFVDERAADGALERMKEAQRSGEFFYDDAAVIRRDAEGKLHIRETGDMSTGKGAGIGALIGGVIGILAGPAGLAVAVGAGAALGAIGAHHDAGFSNESLKEIGSALVPGSSAIAVTTSKMFVEEVRKQAPAGETLSAAREIASDIRGNLQLRQDVLYSLVITDSGVAVSQVVSSPTAVAVFGIAVTEDGAVAGGAVVTPEGAAYKVAAADEEGVAAEAGVVTDEGAVVVDAYAEAEAEDEASEDEATEEEDKE